MASLQFLAEEMGTKGVLNEVYAAQKETERAHEPLGLCAPWMADTSYPVNP